MSHTKSLMFLIRVAVCLMVLSSLPSGRARAADHEMILWTVEWSYDGSQFAVGGTDTLWVFDSKTLERKSLLQNLSPGDAGNSRMAVTAVSWHPSSNLLAVSSQGGDVNGIWDTASGNRLALRVDQGRGVAWSTAGDLLATSSPADGHLRIWKSDCTLLHDLPRHKDSKGLTGVSWQPSGDRIVTIGNRVTLHDARGKVIRQVIHRPEANERLNLLLCVEWHPSGRFFAVGDYGNEVDDPVLQFWSADGDLLKSVPIEGGAEIRNISWNHDGSLLASAGDRLRIWTKGGELKSEGQSPDLLWGVAWHPDGDRIVTSSLEGRVTLWSPTAEIMEAIIVPSDSQPTTQRDRTTNSVSADVPSE